eukprot:439801-Pyramimonas_sp.AAC.1
MERQRIPCGCQALELWLWSSSLGGLGCPGRCRCVPAAAQPPKRRKATEGCLDIARAARQALWTTRR